LEIAINRYAPIKSDNKSKLTFLENQYQQLLKEIEQIVIPNVNSHSIISIDAIIKITAEGSYVVFYLEDGQRKIFLLILR